MDPGGPGVGAEAAGDRAWRAGSVTLCVLLTWPWSLLPLTSALLFPHALRLHQQRHSGFRAVNASSSRLFSFGNISDAFQFSCIISELGHDGGKGGNKVVAEKRVRRRE